MQQPGRNSRRSTYAEVSGNREPYSQANAEHRTPVKRLNQPTDQRGRRDDPENRRERQSDHHNTERKLAPIHHYRDRHAHRQNVTPRPNRWPDYGLPTDRDRHRVQRDKQTRPRPARQRQTGA